MFSLRNKKNIMWIPLLSVAMFGSALFAIYPFTGLPTTMVKDTLWVFIELPHILGEIT